MKIIKDILQGWGNLVKDQFNLLDEETKELSELRLYNCHFCHLRDGNMCSPNKKGEHIYSGQIVSGCGCNIAAKSLAPDARCPLGKW